VTADRPYQLIADYGLIGDRRSCALVARDGSIDYACFPRFDSKASFSRILDRERGGYFAFAPKGARTVSRRYQPDTMVIETEFETETGAATLVDFMPIEPDEPHLTSREAPHRQKIARALTCTRGSIEFVFECRPRFDYGTITPLPHLEGDARRGLVHGGTDALSVFCTVPLTIDGEGFVASARISKGDRICGAVAHEESFTHKIDAMDDDEIWRTLDETAAFWRDWASCAHYHGAYRDEVVRSALTLKALTYAPTGALIAAPTTSLPEKIGGARNWDYRFTWIRDATLALYALGVLGYEEEARAFHGWLEWSTMGHASELQPLYGVDGERRLTEVTLEALSGYRDSTPVCIGNGAYTQSQLDVYGELLDSAHQYRRHGGEISATYWQHLCNVVEFVIDHWREPDEGIWETRGGPKHFVLSKVMCWVALDRAIKAARALGLPADLDRWRRACREIRADIDANGYDADRGAFVQHYGNKSLDASNLLLPLVGFTRATDPRMRATIEATARELTSPDGFVYRYRDFDDGLSDKEGTFLICTFWLADNFVMLGELDRAQELFDRARSCANDLGLLGEQFDPHTGEILGNFPQAFSHLGLINTAVQLERGRSGEHMHRTSRES
jgi:GH15 family glucan-1,4-alpha-glucosidase